MADYTGDIGVGVRSKKVENGMVVLTLSQFTSTLDGQSTNELLKIVHGLSSSSYTEITDKTYGFPYTFPLIFGD